MKHFIKRIITCLFAVCLLISPVELDASAADTEYPIMPCWEYIHTITLGLDFDGTDGYADISITPLAGITTYTEATLNVYRRIGGDWTLVTSDSASSTSHISIDIEFDAVAGQTYKVEGVVTAYGEDGSETTTVSRQDNCPKA